MFLQMSRDNNIGVLRRPPPRSVIVPITLSRLLLFVVAFIHPFVPTQAADHFVPIAPSSTAQDHSNFRALANWVHASASRQLREARARYRADKERFAYEESETGDDDLANADGDGSLYPIRPDDAQLAVADKLIAERMTEKIELVYRGASMGNGLVAKRDIQSGELIWFNPMDRLISSLDINRAIKRKILAPQVRAKASFNGTTVIHDIPALVVFLALQRRLGKKSDFKPYLDLLPKVEEQASRRLSSIGLLLLLSF